MHSHAPFVSRPESGDLGQRPRALPSASPEIRERRQSRERLAATAEVLGVPISYFFGDLPTGDAKVSAEEQALRERLERPETIELVRLYYAIANPDVRRQFLAMVKAVAATFG